MLKFDLPASPRGSLLTANAVENLIGSVRRATRNVTRWRSGDVIAAGTRSACRTPSGTSGTFEGMATCRRSPAPCATMLLRLIKLRRPRSDHQPPPAAFKFNDARGTSREGNT